MKEAARKLAGKMPKLLESLARSWPIEELRDGVNDASASAFIDLVTVINSQWSLLERLAGLKPEELTVYWP